MSKINQNWHQILRKIKVKEMKEEVGHLKAWIDRLLDYKNRQIYKLMNELEEAEEQYLNNFNAHSKHLDNSIESQNEYINKLQSQYQEELDDLLDQAQKEQNSILDRANSEMEYLKTVIFGQETKAAKELRDSWEYYSIQLYEIEYNNRIKLRHLRTTRGETESALWRQILQIVSMYVQRTDVRRSHLQELRRMDAESADEISRNQERINREEELITTLNTKYNDLLQSRTDKIKSLEQEEKKLKIKFLKVRKSLKQDLALDETKLTILTATSNDVTNELSEILTRGRHLLNLSSSCQKFVTEREKVSKWLPMINIEGISEPDDLLKEEEIRQEDQNKGTGLTDDQKLQQKAFEKGFSLPKLSDESIIAAFAQKQKIRPKTAIPSRFSKSATSQMTVDSAGHTSTPEITSVAPIEEVRIEAKKYDDRTEEVSSSSSPSKKSLDGEKNFLEKCYENLEKMENFWVIYNKVNIDVMELKNEKKFLDNENKQLRGIIRAVLEAAALAKSKPESRVSTRAPSQRRSAYSAPLRRIVFN